MAQDGAGPETARRRRALRTDAGMRRGLILDAAERVFEEQDPLLVTFEEVASAAGVSRALVHRHVADRRDLLDAVQLRVVGRLERWVAHGVDRAGDATTRRRAIVFGLWSFVDTEGDAWALLATTGGLDHPAVHALRDRWVTAIAGDGADHRLVAQLELGGLLAGIGGFVGRGIQPEDLLAALDGPRSPRHPADSDADDDGDRDDASPSG